MTALALRCILIACIVFLGVWFGMFRLGDMLMSLEGGEEGFWKFFTALLALASGAVAVAAHVDDGEKEQKQ